MRREPSPAHRTGEAELVEPLGIVIGDASGKDVSLPGIGGNFKTLQLTKNFQRPSLADEL